MATEPLVGVAAIRRPSSAYKTAPPPATLTLTPPFPLALDLAFPRVPSVSLLGSSRRRGHAAAPARPVTSRRHATLPIALAVVPYVFALKQSDPELPQCARPRRLQPRAGELPRQIRPHRAFPEQIAPPLRPG